MNVASPTIVEQIEQWLSAFEVSLKNCATKELSRLFDTDDCYWRDVLALTWNIATITVATDITSTLISRVPVAKPTCFRLNRDRTPVREITIANRKAVEAIFEFETDYGRCSGVVRMSLETAKKGDLRAWTLFTGLDELKGFEEKLGPNRPIGESNSRNFQGPNWLDLRRKSQSYDDRDPTVLVVGGGQAGLCIAARLAQLGVDTLVVDREKRVGDNWRNRYHALTLHNSVEVNHLPYMPFPPNWPKYVPKDKLGGWFEAYAEAMELNVWTGTEFCDGLFDDASECWSASLRLADGTIREIFPRHIVMATGVSGIPNIPSIESLENFGGTVVHSTAYRDAADLDGQNAIVIGSGNSGHDIAQDLHSAGAGVTLVQRGSTMIINVEPSAQLAYSMFEQGLPLNDCDLLTISIPLPLTKKIHVLLTKQAEKLDRSLLDKLAKVGFKLDFGDENTGWLFKYLTRGGGYYFNVGCSDLIAEKSIGLAQFEDIAMFTAKGAIMKSGRKIDADIVVLATGYKPQEYLVSKLFGEEVADRVGPIWGFGEGNELRNMFTRTPQPGLWFMAGSLSQCRVYSKFLGLQIKAAEEGLLPDKS